MKLLHEIIVMKSPSFHKVNGTVMQIEKELENDCLRASKVSGKFRVLTIYNFAVPVKFATFLKGSLLFNSFCCLFCL